METIKNYLENMFMHMPNTAEVNKAKDELGQMMEDKYAELIEAGKSENEAVGTVIAEFGNLSELAEALGIENVMNNSGSQADTAGSSTGSRNENRADTGSQDSHGENGYYENNNRRLVTMAEAAEYLKAKTENAFEVSFGVMLILLGLATTIILDTTSFGEHIGGPLFIIFIACAVGIFIIADTRMKKWNFISKMPCVIDFATSKYVESEKNKNENSLIIVRTIGIILCIVSFVPAAILDEFNPKIFVFSADDLGGALLFVFIGIAVFMIIYSNMKLGGYKTLLYLNDRNTMAGNYSAGAIKNEPDARTPEGFIQAVYWPTITCIYLSWSFLTFDWSITWVIWPVAAIIKTIIDILTKKDNE